MLAPIEKPKVLNIEGDLMRNMRGEIDPGKTSRHHITQTERDHIKQGIESGATSWRSPRKFFNIERRSGNKIYLSIYDYPLKDGYNKIVEDWQDAKRSGRAIVTIESEEENKPSQQAEQAIYRESAGMKYTELEFDFLAFRDFLEKYALQDRNFYTAAAKNTLRQMYNANPPLFRVRASDFSKDRQYAKLEIGVSIDGGNLWNWVDLTKKRLRRLEIAFALFGQKGKQRFGGETYPSYQYEKPFKYDLGFSRGRDAFLVGIGFNIANDQHSTTQKYYFSLIGKPEANDYKAGWLDGWKDANLASGGQFTPSVQTLTSQQKEEVERHKQKRAQVEGAIQSLKEMFKPFIEAQTSEEKAQHFLKIIESPPTENAYRNRVVIDLQQQERPQEFGGWTLFLRADVYFSPTGRSYLFDIQGAKNWLGEGGAGRVPLVFPLQSKISFSFQPSTFPFTRAERVVWDKLFCEAFALSHLSDVYKLLHDRWKRYDQRNTFSLESFFDLYHGNYRTTENIFPRARELSPVYAYPLVIDKIQQLARVFAMFLLREVFDLIGQEAAY